MGKIIWFPNVCSTDIVVIVSKVASWIAFLLATVSSEVFINYTDKTSTGTKILRTNWKTMNCYALCLPLEPREQALPNTTVLNLGQIIKIIHNDRNLVALRHILLPKLVSGTLYVDDAKKFMVPV